MEIASQEKCDLTNHPSAGALGRANKMSCLIAQIRCQEPFSAFLWVVLLIGNLVLCHITLVVPN